MLGAVLGNYCVLAKLGEGGMGAVYTGEHTLLGKRVAIKVLLPEFCNDEVLVKRFFNEARAATRIRHPGIVEVFDFGYHESGSGYIVMEYLEGESLASRLHRVGRMPIVESLRLIHQIGGALAAAHGAGITHRDLKPDNIFVCPDPDITGGERAKVLDFGIAKLAGEMTASGVKTRTGALVGTPRYMAPEQCSGGSNVDHRADLYAVGCIAFAMICGRPPFQQEGLGDLLSAHMFAEPPWPSSLVASAPPAVDSVILRLLAKHPGQRYQTAGELLAALEQTQRALQGGTVFGQLGSQAGSVPAHEMYAVAGPAPASSGSAWPATGSAADARMPRVGSSVTNLAMATTVSHDSASSGSRRRTILASVLLVLLGAGSAWLTLRSNDDSTVQDTSRQDVSSEAVKPAALETMTAALGDERLTPAKEARRDRGNRWIRIQPPAGGPVLLGLSASTAKDKTAVGLRPERKVYAPRAAYELQQHEVTWSELEPWLADNPDAVVYRPAWAANADSSDKTSDYWPATGVPWETAYRYCKAIGGRLPSEAEWEYAARGAERRPYAWGGERLDLVRTRAYAGEAGTVAAVMSSDQDRTPGEADNALYDLMGNAQEWLADLWRNDRPGEDESWVQADGATYRTVRGLPVNIAPPAKLPMEGAAHRDALCAGGTCMEGSTELLAYIGFRCARDVSVKE